MKKIEVELDDSTYYGLLEMSKLLQISIGSLINNCWHEDCFQEVHEQDILEAKNTFNDEEQWWLELRQERKLER